MNDHDYITPAKGRDLLASLFGRKLGLLNARSI